MRTTKHNVAIAELQPDLNVVVVAAAALLQLNNQIIFFSIIMTTLQIIKTDTGVILYTVNSIIYNSYCSITLTTRAFSFEVKY